MNPLRRYPVLASLLRPFRLSQQKTCAALVAALCQAAQASSFAISACHKPQLARSQNLWEETFLRLVVDRLRAAGVEAVWLCDRGFHRVRWRTCNGLPEAEEYMTQGEPKGERGETP
jgi:hypothetical protein